MYQRQCAASGCTSLAAGFSNLCSGHRKTKTRHGHPIQTAISATRLAPYLRRVQARHRANIDNAAWSILGKRWSVVVEESLRTLEAYRGGAASVRHHVQAAEQVRTLDGLGDPMAVAHVALAMYLMADAEPRAFRSDDAFDYQLVRRVRALAPVNSGTYWCHKERRTKRVYRDLPPRVVAVLAHQLKEAFGLAGLQLAGIERRTVDREEVERKRLWDAIGALQ